METAADILKLQSRLDSVSTAWILSEHDEMTRIRRQEIVLQGARTVPLKASGL
jgi:hypothetical protein